MFNVVDQGSLTPQAVRQGCMPSGIGELFEVEVPSTMHCDMSAAYSFWLCQTIKPVLAIIWSGTSNFAYQ